MNDSNFNYSIAKDNIKYNIIGNCDLEFFDKCRNRIIKAHCWYPTEQSTGAPPLDLPFVLPRTVSNAAFIEKPLPLIILSHGTGGNRFALAWLGIELAKGGYCVCSIEHWGNTFDNKIPQYFVRVWERPLDIKYVINALENNHKLTKNIDFNRMGMAGFSLGGYTALALAGAEIDFELLYQNAKKWKYRKELRIPELPGMHRIIKKYKADLLDAKDIELTDTRIKAFVAMAPALGLGFDRTEQFSRIQSPILIYGAEKDKIAPPITNAEYFHNFIKNSEYIELKGKVGHYIFLNLATRKLQKEAKKFFKDAKDINRGFIHNMISEQIINFLSKELACKDVIY